MIEVVWSCRFFSKVSRRSSNVVRSPPYMVVFPLKKFKISCQAYITCRYREATRIVKGHVWRSIETMLFNVNTGTFIEGKLIFNTDLWSPLNCPPYNPYPSVVSCYRFLFRNLPHVENLIFIYKLTFGDCHWFDSL